MIRYQCHQCSESAFYLREDPASGSVLLSDGAYTDPGKEACVTGEHWTCQHCGYAFVGPVLYLGNIKRDD